MTLQRKEGTMSHPLASFARILVASAALTAVLLYIAAAGRAAAQTCIVGAPPGTCGIHCYPARTLTARTRTGVLVVVRVIPGRCIGI